MLDKIKASKNLEAFIFMQKKKDGGFPSFNYGIKGYWEFMRGYMVNNHLNNNIAFKNMSTIYIEKDKKMSKNKIKVQNKI